MKRTIFTITLLACALNLSNGAALKKEREIPVQVLENIDESFNEIETEIPSFVPETVVITGLEKVVADASNGEDGQDSAVTGENKPITADNTAVTSEGTPVSDVDSPVDSENTPVIPEDTLVASEDKLVVDEDKPVAEEDILVADEATRVTDEDISVTTEDIPVISLDGLFNMTELDGLMDLVNGTEFEASLNATSQVLNEIGETMERFSALFGNFISFSDFDENNTTVDDSNRATEVAGAAEEVIKQVVEKETNVIENDLVKIEKAADTIAKRVCTSPKNNENKSLEKLNITRSVIKDENTLNATSGGIKFSFKISMSFGPADSTFSFEELGEDEQAVKRTKIDAVEKAVEGGDESLVQTINEATDTAVETISGSTAEETLQLHEVLNITDISDLANFLNSSEEIAQVMNATNDLLGHINEGFDSIGKMIEEVFETVGSPVSTQQPLISVLAEGGPVINIPGFLGVNTNSTDGELLSVNAGNTTRVQVPGLLNVQVGERPHPPPANNTLVSISANEDGATVSFNLGRNRRMARQRLP